MLNNSQKVKISLVLVFAFSTLNAAFAQDTLQERQTSNTSVYQLAGFDLVDSNHLSKTQNQPLLDNSVKNMDAVLEQMPELQLVKRGGYAFDPQINSLQGGQVSTTIDGMRLFGACTDKMDPVTSYVEPINLKQADVSCHAGSSLEAGNLGGGLNLGLKKAQFDTAQAWSGSLGMGYQSVSQGLDFNGALQRSGPRLSIRLSGAWRDHQDYSSGGDSSINYTGYSKQNWSANLRFRASQRWILESDYIYDRASDVGYAALPMDVSLAEMHLLAFSAFYYPVSSWLEKVQLKGYYNDIYHEMDDSKRPDEEVAMRMDMPGWSTTQGAFAKFHLSPWSRHRITAKVDYYSNFRRAEMTMFDPDGGPDMFMLTWPDIRRNSFGISVEDQWQFNKNNSLILAGRIDVVNTRAEDEMGIQQLSGLGFGDEQYQHTPYALEATWKWNSNRNWFTKLTTGTGSRVPTSSEMYGYYLFNKEDGYDYIGTPNIDPEIAQRFGFEVGKKNRRVQTSLSSNVQRIEQYIYGVVLEDYSAMTIGGKGVKQYQNTEGAVLFNTTLKAVYSMSKNWGFRGNLAYHWGEQFNGSALPQIQPFQYLMHLQYAFQGFRIKAECEGAAAQERIDVAFGEDVTADWAVLNLKMGYDFPSFKQFDLLLNCGVENVFDGYYHRHLDWGNVPRPGRNFYLNLAIQF